MTTRTALSGWVLLCLTFGVFGVGCGGGGSQPVPTQPSPAPPTTPAPSTPIVPPSAPTDLTSTMGKASDMGRSVVRVTLRWQQDTTAQSIRLEIGSTSNTADILTTELPADARNYDWAPPPTGSYFARVKARNQAGETSSSDIRIELADIRDIIDALYLGMGPLRSSDGGCFFQGMLNGWESGSRIRLVPASSLSPAQLGAVSIVRDVFGETTAGTFRTDIVASTAANPSPRTGEITIAEVDDIPECASTFNACTIPTSVTSQRLVRAAQVKLRRPVSRGFEGGIYHELGHALFGLCHLDGRSPLVGQDFSAMTGAARLTELDREITRRVYGAGLRPGASRSRFVAAGLVRP
jgi:hypothetical protein